MSPPWYGINLLNPIFIQTIATLHAFFLAMALYPEVQRKAQAEVDAVVGTDRLPDINDRDRLPYVNATYLELLRWLPVAPVGAW